MKSTLKTLAILSILSNSPAFAEHGGAVGGNGGDPNEKHFQEIAADIQSWIQRGGSAGLELPNGFNLPDYNSKMLSLLQPTVTVVNFVDAPVMVGTVEKVCKNYFTESTPRIECNSKKFAAISDAEKYPLIHHEFAGLAGFEKNTDEVSNYTLSNQLSAYLVEVKVLKLSLTKAPTTTPPANPIFVCNASIIDRKTGAKLGNTLIPDTGGLFRRAAIGKFYFKVMIFYTSPSIALIMYDTSIDGTTNESAAIAAGSSIWPQGVLPAQIKVVREGKIVEMNCKQAP